MYQIITTKSNIISEPGIGFDSDRTREENEIEVKEVEVTQHNTLANYTLGGYVH